MKPKEELLKMTAEQLCECSPEELDQLSMVDIEEYFKPFWPTTRPVSKAPQEEVKTASSGGTAIRRGRKSTNPDEIKFLNNLTPEKRKYLQDNGLL